MNENGNDKLPFDHLLAVAYQREVNSCPPTLVEQCTELVQASMPVLGTFREDFEQPSVVRSTVSATQIEKEAEEEGRFFLEHGW